MTQKVEGEPDHRRRVLFHRFGQCTAEIRVEDIFLRVFGRPDQILAPNGRKPLLLIIGKADSSAGEPRRFDQVVDVHYGPFVTVEVVVASVVSQQGEIAVKVLDSPDRPPVVRQPFPGHEPKDAFEVGVQEPVSDPVVPESAGQPCQSGRRFAGLGHGRMDEKHNG